MITAHIEDVTIKQIWGDKREFERRVDEYCVREGMKASYVEDLRECAGL